MAAGEEEDYMSDAFLQSLGDVKPGLKTRSQKRKDRASEHPRIEPKCKRLKATEHEAREKALATPISTENKGFSMLKKMGYKKGMGLGRGGTGMTALIPLVLKDGKGGLGRERYVKEKDEKLRSQDGQRYAAFRRRKLDLLAERRVTEDLRKSQKACEQLDSAKGIEEPKQVWFWPAELFNCEEEDDDEEVEEADDEEEEEEEQLSVKLNYITKYLRTEYFYCVWCGTAYERESDMTQHCPGDTAELHED